MNELIKNHEGVRETIRACTGTTVNDEQLHRIIRQVRWEDLKTSTGEMVHMFTATFLLLLFCAAGTVLLGWLTEVVL